MRVIPLLEARQLTKVFPRAQSVVEVLRGCDFILAEGESGRVERHWGKAAGAKKGSEKYARSNTMPGGQAMTSRAPADSSWWGDSNLEVGQRGVWRIASATSTA